MVAATSTAGPPTSFIKCPISRWLTPFVTIGGGRGEYDRDSFDTGKTSTQNQYNFGLGTYLGTSKRFAFRADVRGMYLNDAEKLQPWAGVGFVLKVGRIEEAAAAAGSGEAGRQRWRRRAG